MRQKQKLSKDETYSRRCYNCGQQMVGKHQNYRYVESGLESVVLKNIVVYHCECGSIVPEIPRVQDLHIRIALDLLAKTSLLAAQEIRFLRTISGYSATKLANVMGVTNNVVSRWENSKACIGKESDRLLRFVCFFAILAETKPTEDQDLERALDLVREVRSINLPELMQHVEDKHSGLKSVCLQSENQIPITELVQ